ARPAVRSSGARRARHGRRRASPVAGSGVRRAQIPGPHVSGTVDTSSFDALRIGTDIQRRLGVKTSRDEPLARFTTMRVGGPADLFAEVHNLFELRAIARFARSREIPLFVLGRGSDLVISDAGIRGLVVLNRAQQFRVEGTR